MYIRIGCLLYCVVARRTDYVVPVLRWGNTVNKNVGAVTYSEVSYEVAHIPICVAPTVPLFPLFHISLFIR